MTDSTSLFPLKIAILLITFNRLDTTKLVFEAIKKSQPPRLYIASEGLKSEIPGVSEKVQEVRDFIMNSIDWDCEVFTDFGMKILVVNTQLPVQYPGFLKMKRWESSLKMIASRIIVFFPFARFSLKNIKMMNE
jgi:hypothetical protein